MIFYKDMKYLFVIDKLLVSKLLKFGLVGCSGMIIDFGITYLCKEILKLNKFLSNGIGFIIAATSNYFLNRSWTFNSQNEEIGIQYIQFMIVSIVGFVSLIPFERKTKMELLFQQTHSNRRNHNLEFLRKFIVYIRSIRPWPLVISH